MPLYEIGLCKSYASPATKIMAPYPTAREAHEICQKLNKEEDRSTDLGATWMWAELGKMRRIKNCPIYPTVLAQVTKEPKRDDSRDLATQIGSATELLIKNLISLVAASAAQEQIVNDAHQALALCRTYLSDYIKLRNEME